MDSALSKWRGDRVGGLATTRVPGETDLIFRFNPRSSAVQYPCPAVVKYSGTFRPFAVEFCWCKFRAPGHEFSYN